MDTRPRAVRTVGQSVCRRLATELRQLGRGHVRRTPGGETQARRPVTGLGVKRGGIPLVHVSLAGPWMVVVMRLCWVGCPGVGLEGVCGTTSGLMGLVVRQHDSQTSG